MHQAALNTEGAPLGVNERSGKARTSAAVLLSIAALLFIIVSSVDLLSESTDLEAAAWRT